MPKLILVTAGTSALEKYSKQEYSTEDLADKLNQEGEKSDLYKNVKDDVLKNLKTNTKRYREGKDTGYSKLSAEVASLLAMGKEPSIGAITKEDKIILLHSDTVDGKLCAEVNGEVICACICNNTIIKSLIGIRVQPRDKGEDIRQIFVNQGLNSLQTEVKNATEAFRREHGQDASCYFNITGGYKGVLPFTTVLALNFNLTLVYLYEKSERIIWIKKSYLNGKINVPAAPLADNELLPI